MKDLINRITIRVGKANKGYKQTKVLTLKYKNELASVYSFKLPFYNRFLCATIWSK